MATVGSPARVTPNLFGIPFGLCGLAECWGAAHQLGVAPGWPAAALWVLAAAVWLVVLVAWLRQVLGAGRFGAELTDPTYGPFTALAVIVPMLLGLALAEVLPGPGRVLFAVFLVATVLAGGWLSAIWIVEDLTLAQWHPGYFLPTVAGGLLASYGCAVLGHDALAAALFGYGAVCWLVVGSVVLLRLWTQPRLAPPLLPTMAIEVAPPVVAGTAWFALDGGRPDAVALGLAGYAFLMVVVQLRLVPLYRTAPFGPGWWGFSFSYAAAFLVAIRWLAVADAPARTAWTWALLAVVTAGVAVLAGRTVGHLLRGSFLPRPPAPGATGTPAAALPAAVPSGSGGGSSRGTSGGTA